MNQRKSATLTRMGSTFTCLHVHVVFATRERRASLDQHWRSDLHRYIAGTLTGLGASAPVVGGTGDHVHLLFGVRATQVISDVIREVKKASSIWIKSNHSANFAWQEGYGAFSVGVNSLETVRAYIEQQEQHHKHREFVDEWREILAKHGFETNERL